MAATRSKTGNSKPRVIKVEAEVSKPRKTATKRKTTTTTGTKTKANSSKPRTKKVSDDKVKKSAPVGRPKKSEAAKKAPAKKAAPAKTASTKKATTKAPKTAKALEPKSKPAPAIKEKEEKHAVPNHEPTLLDQVKGAALKVEGMITGKTGKKVCA